MGKAVVAAALLLLISAFALWAAYRVGMQRQQSLARYHQERREQDARAVQEVLSAAQDLATVDAIGDTETFLICRAHVRDALDRYHRTRALTSS